VKPPDHSRRQRQSSCATDIASMQVILKAWIQNMADPQRNCRIEKVSKLAKLHFRRNMEHDCRIRAIFPYCNWNCNRDRNRIL